MRKVFLAIFCGHFECFLFLSKLNGTGSNSLLKNPLLYMFGDYEDMASKSLCVSLVEEFLLNLKLNQGVIL